MKASEIKVGQRLAHSRNRDPFQYRYSTTEVEVIETGVRVRGTSVLGTKVRDDRGMEYPVPNRHLHMPWAEYIEQRDRMDAYAAERRDRKRSEQTERAKAALAMEQVFRDAGVEPRSAHVGSMMEPVVQAAGWETTDRRVATVFTNLTGYVEKGTALTVVAESVAAVLPARSAV